MPNKSGTGYADYVLYGDDGRALAVIEAKRTCKDVAVGRQQAKLYADILEKQFGRRPVVFLTNGFDTRIVDNIYPERKVASIYSKRDLEKWFNLQTMRTSLANVDVNKTLPDGTIRRGPSRLSATVLAARTAGKPCSSWQPAPARPVPSLHWWMYYCSMAGSRTCCFWLTATAL